MRTRIALAVVFAALLLQVPGRVVQGHGGGTPRLTAASVGPYSLFAWTEPEPWRAGEVHVTLAVTTPPPDDAVINNDVVNNLLEQPIEDAVAEVTFRPENGGQPLVVAAKPGTLNAFYLEADTILPAAGRWVVEVAVTGPEGAGRTTFDVDVLPARGLNTWVLAGGVAVLLGLVAVIAVRARRPQAAPNRPTRRGVKKPAEQS